MSIVNRKTATKNKDLLFAGVLVILIFGLLLIHNGRGPLIGDLDITMFRVINQDMQGPVLDNLAALASNIGSVDIYIMSISFFIIFLVSYITRNKELKKLVIILSIAILISMIVVYPLKENFGVSRPYFYLNDVHVYCSGGWNNIEEPLSGGDGRNSFPSGHATRAFTVLGVFWMYKRTRVPLLVFLLLVSFFLVYGGTHYVSDIIMGGVIGFTIGYLIIKNRIQQNFIRYVLNNMD